MLSLQDFEIYHIGYEKRCHAFVYIHDSNIPPFFLSPFYFLGHVIGLSGLSHAGLPHLILWKKICFSLLYPQSQKHIFMIFEPNSFGCIYLFAYMHFNSYNFTKPSDCLLITSIFKSNTVFLKKRYFFFIYKLAATPPIEASRGTSGWRGKSLQHPILNLR